MHCARDSIINTVEMCIDTGAAVLLNCGINTLGNYIY